VTGHGEVGAAADAELTKEELQQRMAEARQSISATVDEIKETVEDQYASVKAAVTGILDWREQFAKEPVLWSVGALSAGFALGYTLARAEPRARGKKSEVAVFAESLAAELGRVANVLPLAALDPKLKRLVGFGLSDLFAENTPGKPRRAARPKRRPAAKRRARARR
jgi:hypothetical protein